MIDQDDGIPFLQDQIDYANQRRKIFIDGDGKGMFDCQYLFNLPAILIINLQSIREMDRITHLLGGTQLFFQAAQGRSISMHLSLVAVRDELVQEFSLGEIIGKRFGLLVKNILQVVAIWTELYRADLAERKMLDCLLFKRFHKQVAVMIDCVKDGLDFCERLPKVHSMIINKNAGVGSSRDGNAEKDNCFSISFAQAIFIFSRYSFAIIATTQ